MNPIVPIVLLTDYGNQDPYVGILKGVISGIAPGVSVIDLTHEIQPGDLLHAAVILWSARNYFPGGTVFCCVVDPGVGTERRAILVDSGGYRFIGPDNGLFTFVTDEQAPAWTIEISKFTLQPLSRTFHGRDVFAPAAAHAALGKPGGLFGHPARKLARLVQPVLKSLHGNALAGEILFADRFGNLLTSLGKFQELGKDQYRFEPWLNNSQVIDSDRLFSRTSSWLDLPTGRTLEWVCTFADKPVGEPGFLVGSSGLIEVVANQGNASQVLGLSRGDRITLLRSGDQE